MFGDDTWIDTVVGLKMYMIWKERGEDKEVASWKNHISIHGIRKDRDLGSPIL